MSSKKEFKLVSCGSRSIHRTLFLKGIMTSDDVTELKQRADEHIKEIEQKPNLSSNIEMIRIWSGVAEDGEMMSHLSK